MTTDKTKPTKTTKPRKKAKTKADLKKSVNRLYKVLMKEKKKHALATAKISEMCQVIKYMRSNLCSATNQINALKKDLYRAKNDDNVKTQHCTDLIKALIT